ncbi:hypothetical protein [Clostridium saccharoperbutylacetonicum]|uniref:hypothetical protein n=1 Tax=Clostridium saccharoperbutylacetonicum TaxID=36745 RepID=UPI0009838EA2|nr:hypothetical protein [Clostridium saccharoperbutylacetonicum]AQR95591.1 hypothetical protein CLSAP_29070 [Clostridium saccharoperbutylacetonicum]NSB31452.1 hypothetical protein [Clostridium saccharoperbutylacetonicum]
MFIQNNIDRNTRNSNEEEFLNDQNIPAGEVYPVKIDITRPFNFYGYKVKDNKKKVFCVGEDVDPTSYEAIFYMYNMENVDQLVTPIRKFVP